MPDIGVRSRLTGRMKKKADAVSLPLYLNLAFRGKYNCEFQGAGALPKCAHFLRSLLAHARAFEDLLEPRHL